MDPNELQRLLNIFTRGMELSNEELENLNNSLAALNTTIRTIPGVMNNIRTSADQNRRATEQETRARQDNTQATRQETEVTQRNVNIVRALTEANSELDASSRRLKRTFNEFGSGLLRVTGQLLDTLSDTSTNLSKYNNVISAASDAAADLASEFGLAGKVIGLAIKGFAAIAQKQIEFVDKTLQATDSLSKMGARAAYTTEEFSKAANSAGRTAADFDKLIKPMQSMGRGFASIGDTARDGAKQFIENIANVSKEDRIRFRNLGVSFDELTQYQADYIKTVERSGRVFTQQEIQSGKVREATKAYVEDLLVLADITKTNVDEVQKQIDASQSTTELALINFDLAKKRQRLEEAMLREGSPEEKKRLAAELDVIKNQQKVFEPGGSFDQFVQRTGMTDIAGQLQVALRTGQVKEDVANRVVSLGIDLGEMMSQVQKGQLDTDRFAKEFMEKAAYRVETMGPAALAAQDVAAAAKLLGIPAEQLRIITQNMVRDIDQQTVAVEARTAMETKATDTTDKMAEARNVTAEKELDNRLKFEKELRENLDATLALYKKMPSVLGTVITALSALAASIVPLIGVIMAAKVAGTVGTIANIPGRLRGRRRPSGGGPTPPVGGISNLLGGRSRLIGGMIPGVGSAMSGMDMISNLSQGNYGSALLDALNMGIGLIPGGGLLRTGASFGLSALSGSMATRNMMNSFDSSGDALSKITGNENQITKELVTTRTTQSESDEKLLERNTESKNLLSKMSDTLSESNRALESMKTNGIKIAEVQIPAVSGNVVPSADSPTTGGGASSAGSVGGFMSGIGSLLQILGGGMSMAGPMGFNILRQLFGSNNSSTEPSTTGSSAGTSTGTQGTPTSEKPIKKVVSSKPGEITVETIDGMLQKRVGAANWRMNNPGNLRPTEWSRRLPGVVGVGNAGPSGDFLVFDTKRSGDAAKEQLLFSDSTRYRNLNIAQAMYTYAPPTENNTQAYINAITEATRAGPGTMLRDLNTGQRAAMLSAIQRMEGFKPGQILSAATGGIVSGAVSGFPAILHGTEMIVPLNSNSILAELGKKSASQIESQVKSSAVYANDQLKDMMNQNQNLMSMLASKLDSVINRLDTSNDTQTKMLRYSQA